MQTSHEPSTMSISEERRALAARQLSEQRVLFDFDVVEHTVEQIASKYSTGKVTVPEYQRGSTWEEVRRCKFIESMLLGLPVSFVFVADIGRGWECVDGAQRIHTIRAFLENNLVLKDLMILSQLNGFTFADLPTAEQRRFRHRTVRIVVLSQLSDPATRCEVSQRINARFTAPMDRGTS